MSDNEPQTTPPAAARREVSRASLHWDTAAPRMPGSPAPAASVRSRLEGQRAKARQHPWQPKCWRAGGAGVLAGVVAGVITVLAGGAPWWTLGCGLAVAVMGTAVAVVWSVRDRFGYDSVGRELREQVRLEERVAASLEPLETAGWVLFHDRLVAAHRVPHLLIGPAGVVLIYPYTLGRHAIARYRARRGRALAYSLLVWVLAVPLSMLRVRPLPHLTATTTAVNVSPHEVEQTAACWARDELAARLHQRPTLDGWTTLTYAYYAVDHRPADRHFTRTQRVGYGDTGPLLRTVLTTGIPGDLNRTAIAFLATEVDDTCPPA